MRIKYIDYYSRSPKRPHIHPMPEPVVEATITSTRSTAKFVNFVRIDTGADVSVLPIGLKAAFGLDDNDSTLEIEYNTVNGPPQSELVFPVNFVLRGPHMSPKPFLNVYVIFRPIRVPLFGIWTALEHARQLACDFPGMTTSL